MPPAMERPGSIGFFFKGEVKLFEPAWMPQAQHVRQLRTCDVYCQHQRG